jgi:hypothetical protein
MVSEGADWMHLAHGMGRWRVIENTVMNLQVPWRRGIYSEVEGLFASQQESAPWN